MEAGQNRQNFFIAVTCVVLAAVLLYFSRRVVTPFLIAFALAYLLDPLADRMESLKISRTLSVVFLMGGFFLLCLGGALLAFPMLRLQAENLVHDLPEYLVILQDWIRPFIERFSGVDPEKAQQILRKEMLKFGELPLKMFTHMTAFVWDSISGLFNILLMLFNLVIIPVAMFYLLRDYDAINERLLSLIPSRLRTRALDTVREVDRVLAGFVRGQLMVALIMAFLYCIGLFICGTPMSLFIALLAGFANLVPYLGLVLGLLPAALLTYLHTHDIVPVMGVAGVFAVVQALEGMIITPRVVGESIGLHPLAIMLAVLLGAEFFGFVGILLAVPAAAVLNVFLVRGIESYKNSSFYSS